MSAAKSREQAGYAFVPFDTSTDARDVLNIALLNPGAHSHRCHHAVACSATGALRLSALRCSVCPCVFSTHGRAGPFGCCTCRRSSSSGAVASIAASSL